MHFILEPLYKIYAQVLGDEGDGLRATLEDLGIQLKPSQYKLNTRPLLRLVLEQFFGDASGFVSMVAEHIPSPLAAAPAKVRACRAGGAGALAAAQRRYRSVRPPRTAAAVPMARGTRSSTSTPGPWIRPSPRA